MLRRSLLTLCLSSTASFSIHPAPRGRVRSSAFRSSAAVMSSAVDQVMKYYKHEADAVTKTYIMQQTMLRVKDPVASLKFYCEVLGFHLIMHRDFPQVPARHTVTITGAHAVIGRSKPTRPPLAPCSGASRCTLWRRWTPPLSRAHRRSSGTFACAHRAVSS